MPAITRAQATEKLAEAVEGVRATALPEIYAELFPEQRIPNNPVASEMARYIRQHLEGEEVVDLWNVVFPDDSNVWFDEEGNSLHFNEESAEYAG